VRFEIVPGGHLGMVTGRGARTSTWVVLDEWIDQWSEPEKPAAPARRTTRKRTATRKAAATAASATKAPTKGTVTQKAAPRRTAATKTVTESAPTNPAAPETEGVEIGTNPTRRYGSAGSRALGH